TIARDVKHKGVPPDLHLWQQRLDAFRHEYNHVRPHKALDLDVPANHYKDSPRTYREHVPEYEYPGGAPLARVNSAGNINHRGRAYFVSQALAGQAIQLNELPGKLVIRFRHMFVREIDLINGTSKPVLRQP